MTPDAWRRWYWLWDAFFAIDFAATFWLVLGYPNPAGDRLVATGAVAAIALSYLLAGRRITMADEQRRGDRWFAAVLVALTVVAVLADPNGGFVLFAVCPMLYLTLPAVPATVVTTLAVLLPPASVIIKHGVREPDLATLLPMTAILALFGVFIGFWLQRVVQQSKERAELIEKLEASRAEVAMLSHEAGTAAERERLAREIHDTLAQGFTSIVTLAQAAESEMDTEPAAARRHLELTARTARENLAEARAMVAALTPSALDAGSLEDAVRRQADRLAEETGSRVRCEIAELPPLGMATDVVLLRAAQEALTNVRKHAHADSVSIGLSVVDDLVRLTVTDDGAGFVVAGETARFGLRGMRTRAEQVGGTLTIRSEPGAGTTVELEVPR